MRVLADTLYRQPTDSAATPRATATPARNVDACARMGAGRLLRTRVRDYFARGWILYLDNARAAAPIAWL